MKFYRYLTLLLSFVMLPLYAVSHLTVTISNPMKPRRALPEMVELDASAVSKALGGAQTYTVVAADGDILSAQLTYDGKLIFPCPDMERSTKVTVLPADKGDTAMHGCGAVIEPMVFGRLYPERQKDFSFENNRVAFRIYGPDTQKKKERIYGYDIFNKRTSAMILDRLYSRQCDREMWSTVSKLRKMKLGAVADDVYNYGFCYHVDHGEGMDCYKVGATLGAGTNALRSLSTGEIVYPYCFADAEVLDNGPLRITVRLTFAPVDIGGVSVVETRVLTLDAGSSMVKAVITHTPAPKGYAGICGIAVHKENPKAYVCNLDNRYIAYDDLGAPDIYQKKYREKQDADKGHCFIGCIMPDAVAASFVPFAKETSGATGHVVLTSSSAGGAMTYYFGNAWDRNPNVGIASMDDWQRYLENYYQQTSHPLKVKLK